MNLGIGNRTAVVTGAGRGIGRAIAVALAREGARVILVGRRAETLEVVRQQLDGQDRRHQIFPADLMEDQLSRLAEALESQYGSPDILVHNAGGSLGLRDPFAPVTEWQRVWYFNVGAAIEWNRFFIPGMAARRWGRIVHLSTLATVTYDGNAAYVSAKCALNGYVKTVNRMVSKDNVIVSAVAPGAIHSEGRFLAKLHAEDPEGLQRYFDEHLPIRRLGRAEDVAGVVAFLCSEQAAFMAGSIVGIDGGGR